MNEETREPRYEHAGKLGPWARNGAEGTRYLACGFLEQSVFKRIVSVEKSGESWRYICVEVEGEEGFPSHHGANTNTYIRR